MPLAKYVQTSGEQKRYQIDWTDWLDDGELISGVTFTVLDVTVPPLVVNNAAVLPTGKGVQYYVSGGIPGRSYRVVPEITTNTTPPQIDEDEVVFVIREPQ